MAYLTKGSQREGGLQHPNQAFLVYLWTGCMMSLTCSSLRSFKLFFSTRPDNNAWPDSPAQSHHLSCSVQLLLWGCRLSPAEAAILHRLQVIHSSCVKHPTCCNPPVWSVFHPGTVHNCSSLSSLQDSHITYTLYRLGTTKIGQKPSNNQPNQSQMLHSFISNERYKRYTFIS